MIGSTSHRCLPICAGLYGNEIKIQYNTIQYNTLQYNTIQYNTNEKPNKSSKFSWLKDTLFYKLTIFAPIGKIKKT